MKTSQNKFHMVECNDQLTPCKRLYTSPRAELLVVNNAPLMIITSPGVGSAYNPLDPIDGKPVFFYFNVQDMEMGYESLWDERDE